MSAAFCLNVSHEYAKKNCSIVRVILITLILLSSVVQVAIEPSLNNVISVIISAIFSCVSIYFIVRPLLITKAPLAFICVFGQVFSSYAGALIIQTFYMTPLVYGLKEPLFTFFFSGVLSLVLIAAIYIAASALLEFLPLYRIGKSLNFFVAPSVFGLWALGAIGFLATVYTMQFRFTGENYYGNVFIKLSFGATYLTFSPLLLPILYFYKGMAMGVKVKFFLIFYLMLLLLVAAASNSRGMFAVGIFNLGLGYFLFFLIGGGRIKKRNYYRVLFGILVSIVAMTFISNIATAMVIARSERGELSSYQIIVRTLEVAFDSDLIDLHNEAVRFSLLSGAGEYNEVYIDNPFLNRLISTKFIDNSVSQVLGGLNDYADSMVISGTLQKLIAIFPTPFLAALGVNLDKTSVEYSVGDLIYSATGDSVLGHYRVGSLLAHGISLFGIFGFYIVAFFVYIAFFIFFRIFSSYSKGGVLFVFPLFFSLYNVYYAASGDGFLEPVFISLRVIPQYLLLYFSCLYFIENIFYALTRHRMLKVRI